MAEARKRTLRERLEQHRIPASRLLDVATIRGLASGAVSVAWSAITGKPSVNTTAPLTGGGSLASSLTLTTSMATNKLIGRGAAGTGVMQEITLGTNLSLAGTTLNATSSGSTVKVNTTTKTTANLNDTTPAAVSGANALWQASGDDVSAYIPAASASVVGVAKLGATGGAQAYSAGLLAVAALYDGTRPNNECWTVGQSRDGASCWRPTPRVAYAGWKAQVSYGASDTWTIIGSDTSGSTGLTQTTVGAVSTNATNGLRVTSLTSGASSGSVVGFRSSAATGIGARATQSVAVITGEMPGTLTSSRIWLGWMTEGTTAAMGAADAPASLSYIGVLRSTGLANTNLWIVEANATNVLSTDTGIATASIPASTEYSVAFSWDSAKTSIQVWLSIAGGAWSLIGTASTYVPIAGTGLAIGACTTALSASARTCSLHSVEALRD